MPALTSLAFLFAIVFKSSKTGPTPPLLQMECTSSVYLPTFHMGSSFFLWLFLIFSVIFSPVSAKHSVTWTYGVNYGRIANNLPQPESVVTLLKAAKINHIRIYDADHGVLQAFKRSGIEIIIGLPNEYLKEISIGEDRAMNWVQENVQSFLPDTRIRGIAVGNEILGGTTIELWEVLLPAAKNVYSALYRLGLQHTVEVSSPHSEAVFANSFPPSACIFRPDVAPFMKPLLEFFSQIGSPFYINAYPFLAYKNDPQHIDINYALFKDNRGIYDAKTKLHYDNMFEAQVDAAYAALDKAGFSKMQVIVSETGWASRGDPDEAGANVKNARTYNRNLRKLLAKKKGTPFRPKMVIKAYVFALFNENLKPGPTSERNFGLFKPDGSISYDVGFTGLVPSAAPPSILVSFKEIAGQGWLRWSYLLVSTAWAVVLL
ncbi:hypothetical protein ES319_A10G077400v1 [Gossypium barbadense]|uniref:glucan endo-1,3-beta-D-glucosidase n=2 Tax=Gossypium TaxID=3633 RepID=A0A5J5U1C4_GOSBA|nr:hypothetical protein ES319_A10G077400v1 [Gossypium barbadense]TYG98025.1 hypothetical protein ES288_A10G084900v1 [Gossypium darwinii]